MRPKLEPKTKYTIRFGFKTNQKQNLNIVLSEIDFGFSDSDQIILTPTQRPSCYLDQEFEHIWGQKHGKESNPKNGLNLALEKLNLENITNSYPSFP